MTNHPRRSMKVEILRDTLTTPRNGWRKWEWNTRVTLPDGRAFIVSESSMTGAFDRDMSRELVEWYLAGTLKSQKVREV